MKTKMKTNFCPHCGAKVPATNQITIVATFIDEGECACNQCTEPTPQHVMPKSRKTAQERIEVLRSAGVDVSHLFAMHGANGGDYVASNKGGALTILQDNDPLFCYINSQGTVPNRHLFRRFVMAQMFHMMSYTPNRQKEPIGVTKMIYAMGYEYQWKMLINELNAQMKMEGKDIQNFTDRNRWFNVHVVTVMAQDYIEQLRKHINTLQTRNCKRIPYKRISGRDIYLSDLNYKVYNPLQRAMKLIVQSKNATQLYFAAKSFNDIRLQMPSTTPQCKIWVDAYKGSGAYFTMQNLIRFHNCIAIDDAETYLDMNKSLAFISAKAEQYKQGEGWRLLATLKKMLEDNNINIKKKMTEWRKRR